MSEPRKITAADWLVLGDYLRQYLPASRERPFPRAHLRFVAWQWCETNGVRYQSLHHRMDRVLAGLLEEAAQKTDATVV